MTNNADINVVTPQRFASGMTFAQYVDFAATPANLAREASGHGARVDRSGQLRDWYEGTSFAPYQVEALKELVAMPGGPAKVVAISEEWSSDCRRDVPVVAKLAEATGLEMRIFTRDGQRFSDATRPSTDESPNADLMAAFLKNTRGQTWQSIPVFAFYTKDFEYLYHYQEFPAIYHKDRIVDGHIRKARAGESAEQAAERGNREFAVVQGSAIFRVWANAAVDEIISSLHRRMVLGEN